MMTNANVLFPVARHVARRVARRAAGSLFALALTAIPAQSNWQDACRFEPHRLHVAQEQLVTIHTPQGNIAGTLAGPATAPPEALVVMLHGYTGARNEIPVAGGEGMYARTARLFAERGIASLRIDFIGSGESDGDWADTRFSGQARDAVRAARWLQAARAPLDALRTDCTQPAQRNSRVDEGCEPLSPASVDAAPQDVPLGVLGYSQGGLVALRAARDDAPFDRVALWNPVMDPMTTYGIIFGEDTIRAGARQYDNGDDEIVAGTKLRPGFFAELVAADPIADAAETEAAIFIATGQRDPLVPNGGALAERIAMARAGETVILDIDASHDLGAINTPALLDDVINCTAQFLLGRNPLRLDHAE